MLTDANTRLHLQKVRLTTEERKKDERFPVFAVGLVLEPLTYSQAKQLGADVLAHCFTAHKAIQDSLTSVTLDLDLDEQCVITRMAEDVSEHCRLRQVRIPQVTITKRAAPDAGETKSKRVSPQQPTLRATFHCLVDSAERVHRDFLADWFAKEMFFTFEPEQENLFTGLHTDPDDEDGDDEQTDLDLQAPAADLEAGDVLDEKTLPQRNARVNKEARRRRQKTDTTPKLKAVDKKGVH